MFESVGKDTTGGAKRQLSSMLLSLGINGGVLGTLIYLGAQTVDEINLDDLPVEVTFFEAAPPPPPPPPPPGGSKPKQTKKVEPKEPDPDPVEEVEPEIEEPEEEPEEEPASEPEEEEGEEGGEEGGVEGGVVGGVVGGVIGGVLGGQLGGFSAVHWTDVKIKRQVSPKYPKAAKNLGISEENCRVRFYIDEKGKPEKIDIEACSKVFHEALTQAALQWRFYPMRSESGQKVKATFLLTVKFRLK